MANATAEDKADKGVVGKAHEKLAEKRRALGRGLESLLPGPRVVVAPAPTLPQSARKDGAPARSDAPAASSPSSVTSPVSSSLQSSSSDFSAAHGGPFDPAQGGRAGTPDAPPIGETVDSLQAVASGRAADVETVFLLGLDQIEQNPYQTRTEFDQKALTDLAGSIQAQGVLQPIVVRPAVRPRVIGAADVSAGEERFILVLGERRLRAS